VEKDLFRLGFLINPVAGMGGKVGLHGTDGDLYSRAITLGAVPVAQKRALEALASLREIREKFVIISPPGVMGHDAIEDLGFDSEIIPLLKNEGTSAIETKEAAEYMLRSGVQLILFSGGDGTARDIHAVIGDQIPILGVPSGVKMRSGAFAYSPGTAGDLVKRFIEDSATTPVREVEILDVVHDFDEGAETNSLWQPTQFFGTARAPFSQEHVQSSKSTTSGQGDAGINELAQEIAQTLDPSRLYLFGPGSTTHKILEVLDLQGNVQGIDAVSNGQIVGKDLSETGILELLQFFGEATLFLGVIGGQGFLLGRGNQQLSAKVIELVSPDNIVLMSSAEKLAKLFPAQLHVDLGDTEIESLLQGYREVLVAPGRSTVCRVMVPSRAQEKVLIQ
jgi:predicted polyphosphate/ATP-dependent NAD kinase